MFQTREPYTLPGVQNLLTDLMNEFGLSEFELAERSGVRPATIYGILAEKDGKREVRRSTLRRIAESLGCKVSFTRNAILVAQLQSQSRRGSRLARLAEEVSSIILASGRQDIAKAEARKIKEMVRVMMQ